MAVQFESDKVEVERFESLRFYYTGNVVLPTPETYLWDFGDGELSNDQSPIHHYKTAGVYTVSLTVVFDDASTGNDTQSNLVTVATTIEDEHASFLLYQFRDMPQVNSFIKSISAYKTLAESQGYYIGRTRKSISNTFTIFLDDIGVIVGLPRNERSNEDYAPTLLLMALVNMSHGQLEALIRYTQLFIDPTSLFVADLSGIVLISLIGSASYNYVLAKQRLELIAAAGVLVNLSVAIDAEVPVEFEYTDEPPEFTSGNELSESTYENNGYLDELY